MSGTHDGPWHDSGRDSEHGSGAQTRTLPPELDPRRPPTRSRPGGPPKPPRPPGRRRGLRGIRDWSRKRLLATIAGVTAVVVVLVFGVGALMGLSILDKIHKINPFPSGPRPSGGAVGDLNILIVGSDSRAGLTKAQEKNLHVGHDAGQRSDTMILLHIPAGGGKADMVSLPRDSYVTIPAHRSDGHLVPAQMNKLNAAYSLGGPKLTIQTVEYNTHVRIDHYLEINFLGFVNMVNSLGGVNICNAKPINDPVHYDSATGGYVGSGLNLPAGTSHLTGRTALEYVRAREFDPAQGDLGRIQRQQKFMAAMMNKAESAGVLLNLPKLDGFLKSVASSITTDKGFGISQIIRLARTLHSMSPKNVNLLTVPLSNTALATPVGSAVKWDPVLSKRLFNDFTQDKPITNVTRPMRLTIPPSDIAVKVLNATAQSGLAASTAQSLSGLGFLVSSTGNAPKGSNPDQTVVLYGPSRTESEKTVVASVPGSIAREDNALGNKIELLVGSNFSGVKHVKISSATDIPSVRTGASNPCS
ncbi:MAG TPA: LCP family protein [Mycobacteriales bacterium]|nr:LCP family protein [Mycobacteriales bacterium]